MSKYIDELPAKTTLVDGDLFVIADSADTNKNKKVTKATLDNYFSSGSSGSTDLVTNSVTLALASNQLPSASWLDIMSMSLQPGKYLILATLEFLRTTTTAQQYQAQIVEGTNVIASCQTYHPSVNPQYVNATMHAIVELTAENTTVTVQARCSTSTACYVSPTTANSTKATRLSYIKLDGIGAQDYTLPIASPLSLGGIKVGDNLSIDADGVLSAQSGGLSVIELTNISLDDVVTTGLYIAGQSVTGKPFNPVYPFFVEVFTHTPLMLTRQIIYNTEQSSQTFQRQKTGSVWSAWKMMIDEVNVANYIPSSTIPTVVDLMGQLGSSNTAVSAENVLFVGNVNNVGEAGIPTDGVSITGNDNIVGGGSRNIDITGELNNVSIATNISIVGKNHSLTPVENVCLVDSRISGNGVKKPLHCNSEYLAGGNKGDNNIFQNCKYTGKADHPIIDGGARAEEFLLDFNGKPSSSIICIDPEAQFLSFDFHFTFLVHFNDGKANNLYSANTIKATCILNTADETYDFDWINEPSAIGFDLISNGFIRGLRPSLLSSVPGYLRFFVETRPIELSDMLGSSCTGFILDTFVTVEQHSIRNSTVYGQPKK